MANTQEIIELARRDVARRRHNEMAQSATQQQPWLYAFLGVSVTLLIGIFFLPFGTLADRLQMIAHGVCAQQHYLTLGSYTMPLCARNTGIYAGFLATVLYLVALERGRAAKIPPISVIVFLVLAIVAMAVDGFNSLLLDIGGFNVYTPDNRLRVITGLGMGMAIGTFFMLMFNLSLRYEPQRDVRVIRNWAEVVGGLVVAALLYALVFFAPTWLFYPLAIFSVTGIIGVLFVSNMFVAAMLSGLEGRVLWFKQLAKPATIGIVLTAVELGLLAGMRMWLEHSVGKM